MTPATTHSQVRLRFAKRGDLRLISHHDMMRCLERMVRRAKLPLATSRGFNPRPRIVFASALGLGVEALREVVDLELTEPLDSAEVLHRLAAAAVPGLTWLEARSLAPGESPPRPQAVSYQLTVPAERIAEAAAAVATFLESSSRPYQRRRPDRTVALDLRPFVTDAALTESGRLVFRVKVTPEGTARGEEIVETLGLSDLLEGGAVLIRTDVELAPAPAPTSAPASAAARDHDRSAPRPNLRRTENQPPASTSEAAARPSGPETTAPGSGPAQALVEPAPGAPDAAGRPNRARLRLSD